MISQDKIFHSGKFIDIRRYFRVGKIPDIRHKCWLNVGISEGKRIHKGNLF